MRSISLRLLLPLLLGVTSLALLPSGQESLGPIAGPADSPMEARPGSPVPAPIPTPADPEIQALQGELERILTSTGNRTGRWGVLAVSLDRGDTILALNHRIPLIPASNQKLLTTAAALHTLGPDFRFSTFLLTRGTVVDQRLRGDLILYGTGDPTLSDRFYRGEMGALDTLAHWVVEAGIQEIEGDLIVDGSYFRGPDIHPEWDAEDLNDPFAAPVPAISFNENILTVRVQAGDRPGPPPTILTMPEGSGIPVVNTAVTAPRGTPSRIWLFRETPWDPIGIEGEIPMGGRDVWRELPVPDPLVFTGREMVRALEAHGVDLSGHVRVNRNPRASALGGGPEASNGSSDTAEILGTLESPPLLEILRVVNKESHNLFAEAVGKTLGRMMVGEGSFQGAQSAISRFLAREVGISPDEVTVRDGSGLSPQNRLSAGAVIQLLAFMASSSEWEEFWSTLPEAGVRRELRRMGGTPASRNLRAKTGTMDSVSALSGMVRTRSGERILFSILSNEVSSESRAKRAEDQVGIRLASLTRPLQDSGGR